MFHGYEWQGHRLEVELGKYIERNSSSSNSNNNNRPPPPRSDSSSRDSRLPPPVTNMDEYHINAIPPPVSAPPLAQPVEAIPPAYHQSMYRYGAPEPAPPPSHLPPPPMYTSMSLVGGPAANLPTHGHNQIFVNNVTLKCI
jgi:hypothetical protein